MADLLEQVYKEPPAGRAYGPRLCPAFQLAQDFSPPVGGHIPFALRLPPEKLFFFHKGLAGFWHSAFTGMLEKAHVPQARARPWSSGAAALCLSKECSWKGTQLRRNVFNHGGQPDLLLAIGGQNLLVTALAGVEANGLFGHRHDHC